MGLVGRLFSTDSKRYDGLARVYPACSPSLPSRPLVPSFLSFGLTKHGLESLVAIVLVLYISSWQPKPSKKNSVWA